MKKIWFIIAIASAVFAGGWYYYNLKGGPVIPFDALTHVVVTLIGLYVFGKLRIAYKRTNNLAHKYFSYFILGWLVAGFAVAVGNFYFFDNPFLFGLAFAAALLALFPGTAYLLRIPFLIKHMPKAEKLFFWGLLVVGALVILLNVFNFPQPYVNQSGFTVFNSPLPLIFGTLPFSAYALITVIISLFFFSEAVKAKDSLVRIRSVLIALGSLLSVGLGFHLIGAGALSAWGELSVAVGFLLILAGVLYKD